VGDEYGPWDPVDRQDLADLMDHLGVRWWFTGGHALELHLGRSWRGHEDVDVSIVRGDIGVLRSLESEWEIHVAAAGVLRRWDGTPLSVEANENNVWLRRPGGPWGIDLTIGDGDEERWVYRRDTTFSLPWDRVVLRDQEGLPYLTPAIQMLFKSKQQRPKDDIDAAVVIPTLDDWSLAVLDLRLPAGHSWGDLVAAHRRGMRADDVVTLLDAFERDEVDVWVDGGWGIDALLGAQQRRHADLDLALPTRQWGAATDTLEAIGFATIRDDGPYNQVLVDDDGRVVDLHAFDDESTVIGDDGVERHGPKGLAYVTGGFDGRGIVAGRTVRCMTAEFQMWSHTGYVADADDFHDVERLHRRFGLPIPAGYEAWLDGP